MADLPEDSILRNLDGDYDFSVDALVPHMFALKGAFDGATVTMKILDPALSSISELFVDVIDGVFTDQTENEIRPTSSKIRLTLSGANPDTEISVLCRPIRHYVS